MTAISTAVPLRPVPAHKPALGWVFHDSLVTARRHLIQTIRVPELIFFSLVQPVIFLIMFAYVFGGAIGIPGEGGGAEADVYREFLIPGILAQNVAFAVISPTVGIAEDMKRGIIDRFRSLPMAPAAVLAGRTITDVIRNAMLTLVVMGIGLLIGWRINNGLWNWLFAFGLILLFAYAMSWVGSLIGQYMPNPEVASTAGLIWIFPLTFISTAFVPTGGMPAWMQTFAEWNPISTLALSLRQLFGNPEGIMSTSFPSQHPIQMTIAWSIAILVIVVPLAVRKFKRTQ